MFRKAKTKNSVIFSLFKKIGSHGISIGNALLDVMLEVVEFMPMAFETKQGHLRRISGWPKKIPRYRLQQEIVRMKKRGWVIEARKSGKIFLELTEQGRLEALYRRLEDLAGRGHKKWDGKWRMIMFDIPERGRRERYAMRAILRSVGFYRMQKSVYIFPYEIPKELVEYLKAAELLPFIRFARIDQLDEPRLLKKIFKL